MARAMKEVQDLLKNKCARLPYGNYGNISGFSGFDPNEAAVRWVGTVTKDCKLRKGIPVGELSYANPGKCLGLKDASGKRIASTLAPQSELRDALFAKAQDVPVDLLGKTVLLPVKYFLSPEENAELAEFSRALFYEATIVGIGPRSATVRFACADGTNARYPPRDSASQCPLIGSLVIEPLDPPVAAAKRKSKKPKRKVQVNKPKSRRPRRSAAADEVDEEPDEFDKPIRYQVDFDALRWLLPKHVIKFPK